MKKPWIRTVAFAVVLPLAVVGALASAPLPAAGAEPVSRISAAISSLRNDRGTVLCSLYRSADGFPGDPSKALRRTQTRPKGGKATCAFLDLPAGSYAIGVLHDENDNGKMDTNFIGLPKEGYGASNDAKATFGPPRFQDAKVDYQGGLLSLEITMRYLL